MIQLNNNAWVILAQCLPESDRLKWTVTRTKNNALVVDAGCSATGSLAAGLKMAEIGMGGLGEPTLLMDRVCGIPWTVVETRTCHPTTACLLSPAAHWPVEIGDYRAMGSGPACLLRSDSSIAQEFAWQETGACAVLVLESAVIPDETVCQKIAEACGVKPGDLAVIVAPTSSLAGSAQIAARSVETAIHKLHQMGFPVGAVVDAVGRCPVSPPTGDDLTALGKTNDMMMFGSQVWLAINHAHDLDLAAVVKQIPASASSSYGEPFLQALKTAGGFYNLDPNLFAPAEITLSDLRSGKIYHAGKIDTAALSRVMEI